MHIYTLVAKTTAKQPKAKSTPGMLYLIYAYII